MNNENSYSIEKFLYSYGIKKFEYLKGIFIIGEWFLYLSLI